MLRQILQDKQLRRDAMSGNLSKRLVDLLKEKIRNDDLDFFRGIASRKLQIKYPEVEVISTSFLNNKSSLQVLSYWILTKSIECSL